MDAFLTELCVTYGWCLSADATALVRAGPVADPEAFADVVMIAYGIDPQLCDRRTRAWLVKLIADWFFAPHGKGSRSRLE